MRRYHWDQTSDEGCDQCTGHRDNGCQKSCGMQIVSLAGRLECHCLLTACVCIGGQPPGCSIQLDSILSSNVTVSSSLYAAASPATTTGLFTSSQRYLTPCLAGSTYCSWGLVLLLSVLLDGFSMHINVYMVLHVLYVLFDLLPGYLLCHLVVHFRKNVIFCSMLRVILSVAVAQ